MATDEDGNLDFSSEPHIAYTLPEDQVFVWGIRIWTTFDRDGLPKLWWSIDGDAKTAQVVGMLELAKLALAQQQLDLWREEPGEMS